MTVKTFDARGGDGSVIMPKKHASKQKVSKESKQYKCDKCGATFTDQEMLEKHKKSHITVATPGIASEPEAVQGQPRTPPSSPPPEPMPPATPQTS